MIEMSVPSGGLGTLHPAAFRHTVLQKSCSVEKSLTYRWNVVKNHCFTRWNVLRWLIKRQNATMDSARRDYSPSVGEPNSLVAEKLKIRREIFTDDNTFMNCTMSTFYWFSQERSYTLLFMSNLKVNCVFSLRFRLSNKEIITGRDPGPSG